MSLLFLIIFTTYIYITKCHDSDSSEINRIEFSPFYDTIIFNDIADIINEFKNNVNPAPNMPITSESDSDENIEDLLSEYQHYLEKAHKQRRNYMEKTKAKNKVPMLRHEKFTKPKIPGLGTKYSDYYYSNTYYSNPSMKLSQAPLNSPLDLFIPINPKLQFLNNFDITTKPNREDQINFERIMFDDKGIIDFPPGDHKTIHDPIKSSCFCKNNQIPCDCDCKQCLIPLDSMARNHDINVLNYDKQKKNISPMFYSVKNSEKFQDIMPNALNIRVKVDVQLPSLPNMYDQHLKNMSHDKKEFDEVTSKESGTTAVNVPFPYFNFPIPLELFGFKKKHVGSPMHKITIHKKKKTKINGNKKHRKKVIALHNLNLEPQQTIQHLFEESYNLSDYNNKSVVNETLPTITVNVTQKITTSHNIAPNKTEVTLINVGPQIEEIKNVTLNITINDNVTEDNHKIANSIETEYTKANLNKTTENPLNIRRKRELQKTTESTFSKDTNKIQKKSNKGQLFETELLIWPSSTKNNFTGTLNNKNNISTIIIEREKAKAKLNMSIESIRNNHTKTVEQAIFGDIDWNDVDTVAPIFISFVGKYLRGILTFCSESLCHSIKCSNKTCIYRTCFPEARANRKGHCTVSNTSDSTALLTSFMDLPSSLAFETLDIIQEKMLGKLFGKMTLCINSKCVTFVVSKKIFLKSKCIVKELYEDHCPNIKYSKLIL